MLDGDPAPLPKKGAEHPQFLAHFYCGQTAGCIKMPLGTEVDLGPRNFVLDGFPAIRERGTAAPPLFSAHVYCGRGRPSQLLLRSSWITQSRAYCRIYSGYTEAGAVAYLNNIPVPKLKCRSLSVR